MKIAIASQNRKTITGHAGKCRKFWVYEVESGAVLSKELLELPIEQSFHESAHSATGSTASHPLDGINVLISGGMGAGLKTRLLAKGIHAVATAETDIDAAVAAWLNGSLVEAAPEDHDHGHDHEHEHQHGHGLDHSHGSQVLGYVKFDIPS